MCGAPDYTRAVQRRLPVEERLRDIASHVSDLLLSEDAVRMFRACVADAQQRSKISTMYWRAGPSQILMHLEAYLAEQHRRGRLNIDNADFAAQHFVAMLKGKSYLERVLALEDTESEHLAPDYLNACIEAFLRAYGVE